jgi:hypothetical protein
MKEACNMNDALLRKKAKCYAHYLYRNTEIEDFHAMNSIIDQQLYSRMLRGINYRLHCLKGKSQFVDKVLMLDASFKDDISKLPHQEIGRTIILCSNILYNTRDMGIDWDDAELVEYHNEKQVARFILGGKFKELYMKSERLTDDNMKIINKDIHNRIYTLLVHQVIY